MKQPAHPSGTWFQINWRTSTSWIAELLKWLEDFSAASNNSLKWRHILHYRRTESMLQADISFQRLKWLLKAFLFGCWDRSALWL